MVCIAASLLVAVSNISCKSGTTYQNEQPTIHQTEDANEHGDTSSESKEYEVSDEIDVESEEEDNLVDSASLSISTSEYEVNSKVTTTTAESTSPAVVSMAATSQTVEVTSTKADIASSVVVAETTSAESEPVIEFEDDGNGVTDPTKESDSVSSESTVSYEPVVQYTDEEKSMLEYIVQQEVNGLSLEHKRIIAGVIVNRVKSSSFPNSIKGVLTQTNQFSSLSNWYSKKVTPDADTKQAVDEVLNGKTEDKTKGALYFYSPKYASGSSSSWFENHLTFLFELEGHRFFK
jgi:N-acetylmuramoyl-L-alanine amidase